MRKHHNLKAILLTCVHVNIFNNAIISETRIYVGREKEKVRVTIYLITTTT